MDIHEIQIDDYVMFDGSVYQVEEISKKGWVHLTQYGNRVSLSSDYILDYLKGVPLTPEILENNGFEKCVWYGKDAYRLAFTKESKFLIDDLGHIGYLGYNSKIVVNFVHQLQHALRLCGITREIFL